MNPSAFFRLLTLILLCRLLSLPVAQADIYWCQIEDNKSAMLHAPVEGKECRLIEKTEPVEPPPPPSATNAPRPPAADQGTLDEQRTFPRIWPQEQHKRDEVRKSILENELQLELSQRDLIYSRINGSTSSADVSLNDYLKKRLQNHMLNIKALRQEIARMQ